MRLIIALLLLSTKVIGQDCSTLDNYSAFHGIKFGKKLPDSLRKYCSISYNEVRGDSIIEFFGDKLKLNRKISEWLNVRLSFSYLSFGSLKDGRIYAVVLIQHLDNQDSFSISKNQYPLFFESVSDEISSFFGKQTSQNDVKDEFSNSLIRVWECSKTIVEFSLTYYGIFPGYSLTITNKELEKQRIITKYSN